MIPEFFVLQAYAVPPGEAAPLGEELLDFGRKDLADLPGFVSGSAFFEAGGPTPEGLREQTVVLMHWKDRPSYESYRASEVGRGSSARLMDLHPKLEHYVGFAGIGDLVTPATHHLLLTLETGSQLSLDCAREFEEFFEQRKDHAPGFLGARILMAEDSNQLAVLFAWRDAEAFRAYRRSEAGREGAEWIKQRSPSIWRVRLLGTAYGET